MSEIMPKIPAITGTIKRRFLINFRIDPAILQKNLPEPFRPKIYNGYAIGGICLIRLEAVRPKKSPLKCGLHSENAAHRFAVEWENSQGVYIPRRDTDSLLNHLSGGRIFPGMHELADFTVQSDGKKYYFRMKSRATKGVSISFKGSVAAKFQEDSCFQSLEAASDFFEAGSLEYSDSNTKGQFDGLKLVTKNWMVKPFHIDSVESSYFNDGQKFPKGSVHFDHALLMEDIPHEWHAADDLCCG